MIEVLGSLADGPAPVYDANAVDDQATLSSLVALAHHVAPLHHKSERLMVLIEKFEQELEQGTPISRFDRGPCSRSSSPSQTFWPKDWSNDPTGEPLMNVISC